MNASWRAVVALVVTGATASAANAAVVTKTYELVSTFDQGPNATITQRFNLTFDPVSNAAAEIEDYASSTTGVTSSLGRVSRYY